MRDFAAENLAHDVIHGYIPFQSTRALPPGEVAERTIIDHPWVQRLRQIHQLQTAWWVFPTAEHSRFQHVLGVMHLASRAVAALYTSWREVCPDVPSRGYVESLARLTGLLHDVGHGPFGHFFDEHFLSRFGLTHETVGANIVVNELGELIHRVRRNPHSSLASDETLDSGQIAFLMTRPRSDDTATQPRWLLLLRSLFCGIYTVDNMDFVLRDAYMTGYSSRAFDLDRLLHYSFFTERGLTIHQRGVDTLVRFIGVRSELFRSVYFHRTVRAIDLTLGDLFAASGDALFPGNPLEHLDAYRRLTDWSLLVDVDGWGASSDPRRRTLGEAWRRLFARDVRWKMVAQRHLVFDAGHTESGSVFSDAGLLKQALVKLLPADLRELPMRIDIARHVHRPATHGATPGVNFLHDPTSNTIRPLTDDQLYRHLPVAQRICRVYAESTDRAGEIAAALDRLLGSDGCDDLTNM